MLKIIHRINRIEELKRIPREYGVEIDVRNMGRKLILNHEPYETGESFEEFCKNFRHAFIIINIKTEGIEEAICEVIEKYGIKDYFWLDLTFPSIVKMVERGEKNIAVRFSEYEPVKSCLALAGMVKWVWVDTFTKLPLDKAIYKKLKDAGFKICLVCPERWGRPEDIPRYIEYLSKNRIVIDAVMTSAKYAGAWGKDD
jgi:hypothetical protein